MKFNCGPSRYEKRKMLEEWHPHFAWWPVRLESPNCKYSRDCRWLEWVMRQGTWNPNFYDSCWTWEYRAK